MKKIKFNIYAKIIIPEVLVIFLMRFFVPILLNYPPNSELPSFQAQIEPISHNLQYLLLGSVGILIYFIVIPRFFNNIFKFIDNNFSLKNKNELEKIRKECFSIPQKIVLFQLTLLIFILLGFFMIMNLDSKLCIKLLLVYFAFFTVIAIISNLLIKKELDLVLRTTYKISTDYNDTKISSKFSKTLLYNLLPFFIVTIITIVLLGYSKVANSVGESNYYYYKLYFNDINTKDILEEVIYTISMSINDNYSVETVIFNVENEEIHKSVLKSIE